jgi:general secretion pathway protein G
MLVDAGLLREPPRDPWGNPYLYTVRGDEVEVGSLGADGAPGGADEDADLMRRVRVR